MFIMQEVKKQTWFFLWKILFTFNFRKFDIFAISMIGWISAAVMIIISFSLPKFQFLAIVIESIVRHFSIDFSKIFSPQYLIISILLNKFGGDFCKNKNKV